MRYLFLIVLLSPFAFADCGVNEAIQTLTPGALYNLRGKSYSGLEWTDKTKTQPTQKEVDQAISDCQAQEVAQKTQKQQAITDAKDTNKDAQTRLDALIKAIDLK